MFTSPTIEQYLRNFKFFYSGVVLFWHAFIFVHYICLWNFSIIVFVHESAEISSILFVWAYYGEDLYHCLQICWILSVADVGLFYLRVGLWLIVFPAQKCLHQACVSNFLLLLVHVYDFLFFFFASTLPVNDFVGACVLFPFLYYYIKIVYNH